MSDWIDRELQRALAVEPSPEYLARVRLRLDAERRPSRWRRPAWAAAAAFAVVAGLLVMLRSAPPRSTGPAALPGNRFGVGLVTIEGRVSRTIAVQRAESSHRPRERREATARGTARRELLVDGREQAALQRLLAGQARIVEPFAGASLDPIDIEPIVIAPLATGGEGVRQ